MRKSCHKIDSNNEHQYQQYNIINTNRIMRSSLMLISMASSAVAFCPVPQFTTSRAASSNLHMSSPVKVPITITGDNIDLTPAISDYVNEKVERTLGKLSSVAAVSHCDVYLTVNKNPKVRYNNIDMQLQRKGWYQTVDIYIRIPIIKCGSFNWIVKLLVYDDRTTHISISHITHITHVISYLISNFIG